ncbi:MAG: NADH:flavin oxidoreductase [Thermodesulfovibrionales bacterium]|jgi:2,4-dienoyl-CoA reductase-like NADH-dependent reductase (Old Yellow Enzyme family)
MLFDPFSIGGLKLRNRIVRSATYEKRADVDGFATDSLVSFYTELAEGGAGLIITGNALVHVSGRSVPQMICIHNDYYIDRLKRITEAVHKRDGKIVLQLVHGGRQCPPDLLGGLSPVGPSAVYDPSMQITPREMTSAEIWEVIDAFADAARRAMYAGFDGVQIHGAHGYLVSEFLSPHTNRRDDYWGGDEERRFHFLEEVYLSMRKEVGSGYPILIKMNGSDFLEGGLDPDEALRIAVRLQGMGIQAVEVSGGMYESGPEKGTARTNILRPEKEAYFRTHTALFKEQLSVPVILVGGIRSRSVAEEILQKGEADLISISRPLIREPDLPNKFREGKETADCISCNGCMRFKKLDEVRCTQI